MVAGMLRAAAVASVLSFASPISAQDVPTTAPPATVLLWPDGAPGALGDAAKDKPSVILHRAPVPASTHPAIVVCPGGGYGHLAMDHEGRQIAAWLNGLGITAVVLDYRHRAKGYGHPYPLLDAQRAVRLVRANADAWGIDPHAVGVIGFSAGGHLASSVCVHHDGGDPEAQDPIDRQSCRPDFAVLCYAVLAFGQDFTHRGSQDNLLGKAPTDALVREMSSEQQVAATTPPTFLWHTTADPVVPVRNSVAYYLALVQHGVPCEMHLFADGPHGIGLAKGTAAGAWPDLCARWLQTRGVLPQ